MADTFELHIDESGSFEKNNDQKDNKARLIGGITVPQSLAQKKDELSLEIMEIGKKYFTQMRSPTDIHISDIDKYIPGKKSWDLRNELISFMNEKMGGARIFFIYDTTDLNREQGLPEAQLYRNMLAHLLQTIVFYHPHFSTKTNFNCMLAHRRFPYLAKFEDALAGHGYLKLKNPYNGKTFFTAITKAELEGIMTSVEKSIRFYSYRKASYQVKPYTEWKNPFMAMADCICNTVLHILIESDSPKNIHRNLVRQFGKERILFYCRSDYELPENLLTIYHQEQFDRFLAEYLRFSETRDQRCKHNDPFLIRPAVQKSYRRLHRTEDIHECKNIIALADNFLVNKDFYRLSDINMLIQLIEDRMDRVADEKTDPNWAPVAYRYHDVCLRYCNHTANTLKGVMHREKGCKIFERLEKKDFYQVRAFHEFVNRATVCDTNEFAFERAIKLLEPVKEKEESLTKIIGSVRNEILGKIYGSVGQNFAFAKKYKDAAKYFDRAGEHLGRDDFMQTSYRAHLALDRSDLSAYQDETCLLFKIDRFPGYSSLIRSTDFYRDTFNLHLILKGLLVFPPHEDEIRKIVDDLTSKINPLKDNLTQHPWELVFIALGRLLESIRKGSIARAFWKTATDFAKSEDQLTFIMIGHSARAWAALSWLDENSIEKARSVLFPVVETFNRLRNENLAPGIFNPNKVSDENGKSRAGWFDEIGFKFLTELNGANEAALRSLIDEFISRFTFNYW